MDWDQNKTPPPMPIPQHLIEHQRAMTGAVAIAAPASPPMPPSQDLIFNMWWKAIVGICVGLGAIGAVTWVIAKQFFVTRDEWTLQANQMMQISNKVSQIETSVNAINTGIKELTTTMANVNMKLFEIELTRRKTGGR